MSTEVDTELAKLSQIRKIKPLSQVVEDNRKEAFLEALEITGNVKAAANMVGHATSGFFQKLRKKDDDFSERWELALKTAFDDMVVPEAYRRAVDGVEEEIYFHGEVVGSKKVYSDSLMALILKAGDPKFQNKTTVDSTIKGTFGVALIPQTARSEDEWEGNAIDVTGGQERLMIAVESGNYLEHIGDENE